MYVSSAINTTSIYDPIFKGQNFQATSTSFSFNNYQNSFAENTKSESQQNMVDTGYSKQLTSYLSTQSAASSIAKAQEKKDEQANEINNTTGTQVQEDITRTQKDQEQFELAMEAYGLSPTDTKDIFMMELIQQGYSEDTARGRANIYNNAGLLADEDGVTYITMGEETLPVHHLSLAVFDPTYKQSLRELYDQLDTEQLKKSRVTTGLGIHVSDLKEIMPRDGSKSSEEVKAGLKEYWDEKYGTPEKIFEMFDMVLHKIKMEEKFTNTKLTDERESVEKFIEIYKKNVNL